MLPSPSAASKYTSLAVVAACRVRLRVRRRPAVGETLAVVAAGGAPPPSDATVQWLASLAQTGPWSPIVGACDSMYSPDPDDSFKWLACCVTSGTQAAVVVAPAQVERHPGLPPSTAEGSLPRSCLIQREVAQLHCKRLCHSRGRKTRGLCKEYRSPSAQLTPALSSHVLRSWCTFCMHICATSPMFLCSRLARGHARLTCLATCWFSLYLAVASYWRLVTQRNGTVSRANMMIPPSKWRSVPALVMPCSCCLPSWCALLFAAA